LYSGAGGEDGGVVYVISEQKGQEKDEDSRTLNLNLHALRRSYPVVNGVSFV